MKKLFTEALAALLRGESAMLGELSRRWNQFPLEIKNVLNNYPAE